MTLASIATTALNTAAVLTGQFSKATSEGVPVSANTPTRAEIRRAERALKKAQLKEWVETHDLHFTYLREFSKPVYDQFGFVVSGNELLPNGGGVICYNIPLKGSTRVKVATAICNPKDTFDKLEGKFLAAKNFSEGKFIHVPVLPGGDYSNQLGEKFATN